MELNSSWDAGFRHALKLVRIQLEDLQRKISILSVYSVESGKGEDDKIWEMIERLRVKQREEEDEKENQE